MPDPRRYRRPAESRLYHVTTQANRKRVVFRDDGDRARFLSLLRTVVIDYRLECFAYCLMTTHYHLVVRAELEILAPAMQALNGIYARSFNRRHRERTHVFGDRYYSGRIESEEHLVATLRYVFLNPLDAGMCARAEDWPWSSYAASLGLVEPLDFMSPLSALDLVGDLARADRLWELVDPALPAAA